MGPDLDPGKIAEAAAVGRDDRAIECLGGGGDDQVLGPTWPALRSDLDEELGVGLGDVEVVVENRGAGDDVVHVLPPRSLMSAHGETCTDAKLRDRDGRDGDLVVVG
jgi:hypothetical protein